MRVAFDIGGTFTDVVLEDTRRGLVHLHKLPTTPDDPAKAALAGLEALLARAGVDAGELSSILHATTIATNAILERKGARTALITTHGFRDVIIIGRQKRPDTYDMYLVKPAPLLRRRDIYEVHERVLADGAVEADLDVAGLERTLSEIAAKGYESIAVCLLHAYAAPRHERAIGAAIAARHPALAVSLSCDVSPKHREYERASTVVANAFVKPLVSRYVGRLTRALLQRGAGSDLFIMQSNGGLISPELACDMPIRIVESGPAAGVLLCRAVAKTEGLDRVLTFDMGGTTAKLGAIDGGEPTITPCFEVDQVDYRKGSGLPISLPAIELIEIGAGGGSLAASDMGIIKVGPASAGADPGPACYGRGGIEPTVTDANLVLGYINPDNFNGGAMRLDAAAAAEAILRRIGTPLGLGLGDAAWGIHAIANANMERAMRRLSLERGRDPRTYSLVAFGGAGPLHAAHLACALGIPRVIVPFAAGLGSAIGMLEADTKLDAGLTRLITLAAGVEDVIGDIYRRLQARLDSDLERMGAAAPHLARFAYLRYAGQGHEIRVDLPAFPLAGDFVSRTLSRFEEAYRKRYGYSLTDARVEAVDWYLTASVANGAPCTPAPRGPHRPWRGHGERTRQAYVPQIGGYQHCAVIDRGALEAGAWVTGPAIIEEAQSTTWLPPNGRASPSAHGHLTLLIPEA